MVRGVADRRCELQLTKIVKPYLGYRFSSREGSTLLPGNPGTVSIKTRQALLVTANVCILGEALQTSSSPVGGWKTETYLSISALGISNAPSGRFRFRSSKRRYNSEYGTSI